MENQCGPLNPCLSLAENEDELTRSFTFPMIDEPNPSKSKRKSGNNSNWPPVNWKTTPGFDFALKTYPFYSPQIQHRNITEENVTQVDTKAFIERSNDWTVEENPASTILAVILEDSEALVDGSDLGTDMGTTEMNAVFTSTDLVKPCDGPNPGSSNSSERGLFSLGTVISQRAVLTGRLGEVVAFKHFSRIFGEKFVKWVNEADESGLPYDIVVKGEEEKIKEYIEVKTTKSARTDWFELTVKEWQFAAEKGESYSIARVVLAGDKLAQVTIFRNPVELCKLRHLQLAVILPKQPTEFPIVS